MAATKTKTVAKKVTSNKVVKPAVNEEVVPVEVKLTRSEILVSTSKNNTEILKISIYKTKLIKNLNYQVRTKDDEKFDKTLEEIEVEDEKIRKLLG